MKMKLELCRGKLLITILYCNKKVYTKINNIIYFINKNDINIIIVNMNDIKSSETLKDILLSMNEFMKKRGGILYLKNISKNDISLLNSHIKVISS